jgi:deoxyribonuclease V
VRFGDLHKWPVDQDEALEIQKQYMAAVEYKDNSNSIMRISAVSCTYLEENNRLYAVAVTFSYPDLMEIEKAEAEATADFPYIPSMLAFREGPVMLKALSRLVQKPDMVIFPAHGRAHPRFFGLASHLGLIMNIPAIGCARKFLVGGYQMPENVKGSAAPLLIDGIKVGVVLRTKTGVKPMFISPGHLCSLPFAIDTIKKCLTKYRAPEPLRRAHLYAAKYKNLASHNLLVYKKC